MRHFSNLRTLLISTIEYAAHGQFGFLSRVVDYSQTGIGGAGIRFAIDESIVERKIQVELLVKMWSERPWMGWGYGAYIPEHTGPHLAPYSYEMVPFALLMKLGVVGFALYLVFWAGLIMSALRRASPEYSILFVGGLAAFLLSAHTNPLLFNFVGMSIVLFFLLWWASLREAFENK